MTSKEFVIWLKGFTKGVHEFNITPKQWDNLKEELAKVSDEPYIGTAVGGWGVPNGTSASPNGILTTTPGTTGHITIANPYIASFGSGSYNPSSITFTTGSNVTYTTNGAPNWYATYFADLNDKTND
jgi:hypothetical protein